MLHDHLVDFEQEGVIAEGAAHALLVEAELCCGDGLALWDQREVELKLLVVTPPWREFPVVLHCRTETHKRAHLGSQHRAQREKGNIRER